MPCCIWLCTKFQSNQLLWWRYFCLSPFATISSNISLVIQLLRVTWRDPMPFISKSLASYCSSFLFLLPFNLHTCNLKYTVHGNWPLRQKELFMFFIQQQTSVLLARLGVESSPTNKRTRCFVFFSLDKSRGSNKSERGIKTMKTKKWRCGEREKKCYWCCPLPFPIQVNFNPVETQSANL